jgi:hypothetical protein
MKVLTGLIFASAVATVAPASAGLLSGNTGAIWENDTSDNAANIPGGAPSATFNPGLINYNSNSPPNGPNGYTIGGFLNGATLSNPGIAGDSMDNTHIEITGFVSLKTGDNIFSITHDDGAVLDIAGFGTVFSQPGPTSAETQTFDVFNSGLSVAELFTLNYNECCGPPAVLQLSVAPAPVPGAGLPSLAVLVLAGALAWARKISA